MLKSNTKNPKIKHKEWNKKKETKIDFQNQAIVFLKQKALTSSHSHAQSHNGSVQCTRPSMRLEPFGAHTSTSPLLSRWPHPIL